MTPDQTAARLQIETLLQRYKTLTPDERKTVTEAGVVRQFVDPLLKALGWPIEDPQRYKYELHTEAGRPDITLLPAQGGAIFVEAKRFGLISELKEARKTISGIVTPGELALPGATSWMRWRSGSTASPAPSSPTFWTPSRSSSPPTRRARRAALLGVVDRMKGLYQ